MLSLSVLVGLLDGIGLALLMPLLELVNSPEAVNADNMGHMAFVIKAIAGLGLPISLVVVLLTILLVFFIKGVFTYAEAYYRVNLRLLFVRKLRYQMIDGLANFRYQVFISSNAGKIQNSLSGEVNQVVTAFVQYASTLQYLIMLLVYISLAFLSNANFALLVVLGGIITNLIYKSIYKLTQQLSRKVVSIGHNFQDLLIQSVQYYKYLKATEVMSVYAKRLKKLVIDSELIQKRMGMLNAILAATREPLIMTVVVVVILIQVQVLGSNLASIILSLLFFHRSLTALMSIQTSWNIFLNNCGSIENAQDFLQELYAAKERVSQENIKSFGDGLRLENLSFTYNNYQPILDNVNLSIKKNETIAFVGESGSGKTTLMNVIVGLLDDYEGKIDINGQDFKSVNIKSLQRKVGYITQESVIFSDSVYNNITLWDPKTPANLNRFNDVLRKSAIYDFVQALPKKEDSNLGNNGIQVSGGQRQRISIARELYKNIELLLLDEATSALDSQTELIIQENIEALKGQYTIVIIAHRLSTVRNADRIVLLSNGKIRAIGSFEELMSISNEFQKMVKLQEF